MNLRPFVASDPVTVGSAEFAVGVALRSGHPVVLVVAERQHGVLEMSYEIDRALKQPERGVQIRARRNSEYRVSYEGNNGLVSVGTVLVVPRRLLRSFLSGRAFSHAVLLPSVANSIERDDLQWMRHRATPQEALPRDTEFADRMRARRAGQSHALSGKIPS